MRPLTKRQEEVMELICEGWTNKQIGLHLGISPQTVKCYLTTYPPDVGAFEILNAKNRAEAAVKFTKLKYNLEV